MSVQQIHHLVLKYAWTSRWVMNVSAILDIKLARRTNNYVMMQMNA